MTLARYSANGATQSIDVTVIILFTAAKFSVHNPDSLGEVLFVKGANGEGARRGRRGCGAAVGDVSSKRVSSFMSMIREPFRLFSELQLDSWRQRKSINTTRRRSSLKLSLTPPLISVFLCFKTQSRKETANARKPKRVEI
uniref:Putative ovule protein n=1 Tax=Solanum chacoense TaxID=4108 RepID=A0A0V0H0C5_SOLCH